LAQCSNEEGRPGGLHTDDAPADSFEELLIVNPGHLEVGKNFGVLRVRELVFEKAICRDEEAHDEAHDRQVSHALEIATRPRETTTIDSERRTLSLFRRRTTWY
jgi:hypothetical protein